MFFLDLILRRGRGTQVVEPVKVRLHELERDVGVEVIRRNDVEHGETRDAIGMIQRHAMPDATAAIVTDDARNFSNPSLPITST